MLFVDKEHREYASVEQEKVCEYRRKQGYDVFPCIYKGRKLWACVRGRHTLVIDLMGYDVFTGYI